MFRTFAWLTHLSLSPLLLPIFSATLELERHLLLCTSVTLYKYIIEDSTS
ncbi:hypothetical protein C5167_000755 [Papaver somniferum]|uniref:Uncharacterized protein n=1 Tax=Papaver somniferum TaxID=3469 RepID=A0A4Y7KWS4_PAPSO|nr:hypothetical protein C5167_000755 [Papaver somniferum]